MKISLFYDHVTVLDYAYLDDHLGVVGNSLVVNVEFIGRTDEEGVVFDFSHAKKKVKEIIDRDCDHRLVIPQGLASYQNNKVHMEYSFGHDDKALSYTAPEEAVCEIPYAHVSDENLLAHLESLVLKEMPETVTAVKLSFTKEELTGNDVFFNYTHGLKEHYGNCQRLLHGHRSTIKVLVNGKRDYEQERKFVQEYFSGNIHFCLWDNVVNKAEIQDIAKSDSPVGRFTNLPSVQIKYESNQGVFEGSLPGDTVYFMQEETTVENLSIHFCKLAKENLKNSYDSVTVLAYEGIAKGSKTTL
jgi:6-pyruvoyl-tetrahydropterin synthase